MRAGRGMDAKEGDDEEEEAGKNGRGKGAEAVPAARHMHAPSSGNSAIAGSPFCMPMAGCPCSKRRQRRRDAKGRSVTAPALTTLLLALCLAGNRRVIRRPDLLGYMCGRQGSFMGRAVRYCMHAKGGGVYVPGGGLARECRRRGGMWEATVPATAASAFAATATASAGPGGGWTQ